MGKIRVYELAKELGLNSKDVIDQLEKLGYPVKNHMSVLGEPAAEAMRLKKNKAKDNSAAGTKPAPAATETFVPKITRIPKAEIVKTTEETIKTTDNDKITGTKVTEKTAEPAQEEKAIKAGNPVSEKKESAKIVSEAVPAKETEKTAAFQPNSAPQTTSKPEPSSASNVATEKATAPTSSFAPKTAAAPGKYARDNRPPRQDKKPDFATRPQQGANPKSNTAKPFVKPYDKDAKPGQFNRGENRPSAPRQDRKSGGAPLVPEMRYTAPLPEKPVSRRVEKNQYKNIHQDKSNKSIKDNDANNYKSYKNNKNKSKGAWKKHEKQIMPPVVPKKVVIGETVILQQLAKSMSKTAAELIKKLFEMGIMATINQELEADTAILLAEEFGITVEVRQDRVAEMMLDEEDSEKDLKPRPPVVTVMGHVDHGKTSLLDAIRETNVIATEAGGITQHIGAYQVEVNGNKITFLDTPGHEAFTAMRARGAQLTDISILVVAADDGVMPQTVEAINHSKAAGVPIIVAINKIDKPNASPDRVRQELTEYGLLCEDWGGETIMVEISAKQRLHIQDLLEMVLLVADMGELRANPKRQVRGTVIEAQLDKGRGPVATLLVQKGTLRVGDNILAGAVFGKVRAMFDYKGHPLKLATPSTPVEVLGFSEVPPPGEIFVTVKDEKNARQVAGLQQVKQREDEMKKSSRVSLDDLFKQISEGQTKELNLILKADVQGSIEALRQSLVNLNTEEVKVQVIHGGVGAINESDIMLAAASNAIIIGFNVRPDANTRKAAETAGVDVRLYRVIYDAIEDIKKAMSGLLTPDFKEVLLGHAEVRNVFKVPKAGIIAGCYVLDGKITRQADVRIIRDGILVFEGKIDSLRRFKDDVKEVEHGYECGISVDNFNNIKEGDQIEAFKIEEIKREL